MQFFCLFIGSFIVDFKVFIVKVIVTFFFVRTLCIMVDYFHKQDPRQSYGGRASELRSSAGYLRSSKDIVQLCGAESLERR